MSMIDVPQPTIVPVTDGSVVYSRDGFLDLFFILDDTDLDQYLSDPTGMLSSLELPGSGVAIPSFAIQSGKTEAEVLALGITDQPIELLKAGFNGTGYINPFYRSDAFVTNSNFGVVIPISAVLGNDRYFKIPSAPSGFNFVNLYLYGTIKGQVYTGNGVINAVPDESQ